jgi:hypothetical protein
MAEFDGYSAEFAAEKDELMSKAAGFASNSALTL